MASDDSRTVALSEEGRRLCLQLLIWQSNYDSEALYYTGPSDAKIAALRERIELTERTIAELEAEA